MRVTIKRDKKEAEVFIADCIDLPGSPPVGYGRSRQEALLYLLYALLVSSTQETNWLEFLKKDEPLMVNNTPWRMVTPSR